MGLVTLVMSLYRKLSLVSSVRGWRQDLPEVVLIGVDTELEASHKVESCLGLALLLLPSLWPPWDSPSCLPSHTRWPSHPGIVPRPTVRKPCPHPRRRSPSGGSSPCHLGHAHSPSHPSLWPRKRGAAMT